MTAEKDHLFKPGKSGNPKGRPKKVSREKITEADRDYFGTDSRKFLERALLNAETWEEGLKYAKELRALQHASLQAVQTKIDKTHTITLRWSNPDEIKSNEQVHEEKNKKIIEASIVEELDEGDNLHDNKEEIE
jgi:hypothetical protein